MNGRIHFIREKIQDEKERETYLGHGRMRNPFIHLASPR
jgi:hypothetical protein